MKEPVTLGEALRMLGGKRCAILATMSGDGPAMRPMTLLVLEGRMYMLTSRNSSKIEQIVRDPVCQIYSDLSPGENSGFIRMSCRAVIVEDQPERDRLFSTVASAGNFWESSADPDFCLLRLDPFAGDLIAPGEMWKRKISMVT